MSVTYVTTDAGHDLIFSVLDLDEPDAHKLLPALRRIAEGLVSSLHVEVDRQR
jgi:hypothetical protein